MNEQQIEKMVNDAAVRGAKLATEHYQDQFKVFGEGLNAVIADVKEIKIGQEELKDKVDENRFLITHLQKNQQELKSDMTNMKSDMTNMKSDMTDMKSDITDMKREINIVKRTVASIDTKVNTIAYTVSKHDQILSKR